MAILRTLNELSRESVVLALEPSRKCIASCTYCYHILNSSSQVGSRNKSFSDDGTFESSLEKAYGPKYDPTNFVQYSLKNRFILGWANSVEPWQDEQQAISILKTLDTFSIPVFLQTKCVNFYECISYFEPFKDNSSVFISIPSLDQRVSKRFEPGTPPIKDRLKCIEVLRDLGFYVIGAVSPWHEEWIQDPELFINTLADCGVNQIFADRLHLNQRQYKVAPDRVMAEMAGGRGKHWPPRAYECLRVMYQTAIANDLGFYSNGFEGVCHGYMNTQPTISPDEVFTRGTPFPYNDGLIFRILEDTFYNEEQSITPANRDDDFSESIIVTWRDVLEIMESSGRIYQEFSYSSLMDIVPIYKRIPEQVKNRLLGGKHTKGCAKMSSWFQCLWNAPYRHQFIWRHPWIKIACNMDGVPFLDTNGNIIGLFDPDCDQSFNRQFRKVESLDGFRKLEFGMVEI